MHEYRKLYALLCAMILPAALHAQAAEVDPSAAYDVLHVAFDDNDEGLIAVIEQSGTVFVCQLRYQSRRSMSPVRPAGATLSRCLPLQLQ